MRPLLRFAALSLLIGLVTLTSGCFGVEEANSHLASMDLSTAKLADQMAQDQKYLADYNQKLDLMQQNLASMHDELASDRKYLEAATESMREMSTALVSMQKMGEGVLHQFVEPLTKKTPDPKTPDAQDLLPPPVQTPTQPGRTS